MESSTRLNKYLALATGSSRREADNMIAEGRVKVNGTVAVLGGRIDAKNDTILLDGETLREAPAMSYFAFNKPRGYVCSRRAQGDSPTIYALLPDDMHNLKPVGRLDRDSSGLLLLTNDGDFAYQMTHPKFHKSKIYEVELDKDLQPLHRQMISDFGVMLEDGKSKFEVERLGDENKKWRITMSEGRNRQIRRTFSALGYEVKKLHRTTFGQYSLGDIKSGEYKTTDIR